MKNKTPIDNFRQMFNKKAVKNHTLNQSTKHPTSVTSQTKTAINLDRSSAQGGKNADLSFNSIEPLTFQNFGNSVSYLMSPSKNKPKD